MTAKRIRLEWRWMITSGAAVGLTMLGIVGFLRLWDGKPYPMADPATAATRLGGDTQAVYDALDLPTAELDTAGDFEADGYGCQYRGLKHLSEQLADSPGNPPGVVEVRAGWALKGVSRAEAVSAMQRARRELARRGWEVADYENSRFRLWLSMKPAGGDDRVTVEANPGGRLEVEAHTADCIRYPPGTPMDGPDEPALPYPVAPVQLRK
ncbi:MULTISPECIES: hypothetical protein [unclassified Streptomyces]|uniref:hypothetical protein n=1 Tax=unclassified Streptomyces TaxID=2593676 RepID=UPI004042A766